MYENYFRHITSLKSVRIGGKIGQSGPLGQIDPSFFHHDGAEWIHNVWSGWDEVDASYRKIWKWKLILFEINLIHGKKNIQRIKGSFLVHPNFFIFIQLYEKIWVSECILLSISTEIIAFISRWDHYILRAFALPHLIYTLPK